MGVALLKFSQGALVGADGRALVVAISATPVVIENVDNTDVGSYLIELLYAPPDSPTYTVEPGITTPIVLAQGNGSTYSGSLDLSDAGIYGCYRIRLTVWPQANQGGVPDIDIRNVAVPLPNRKIIMPPYQKFPDPLPLEGLGAKPDEMNFAGQVWGWAGQDAGTASTYKLVNEALRELDAISSSSLLPTPNYAGSFLFYDGANWGFSDTSVPTDAYASVPIYDPGDNEVDAVFHPSTGVGASGGYDWSVLAVNAGVPQWSAIQANHMGAFGSPGAMYVITYIGGEYKVQLVSGPTPSDGYVWSWNDTYTTGVPSWKSVLDAIPDGPTGSSGYILYWNGGSWGIGYIGSVSVPLVNNTSSGTVNPYPASNNYLFGSNSGTPGGQWVRDINSYIDDDTIDPAKLVAGLNLTVLIIDESGNVEWSLPSTGNEIFHTPASGAPAWIKGSANSSPYWDGSQNIVMPPAAEGTVFRRPTGGSLGHGKDLTGLQKATFDELYDNGTTGTGTVNVDLNVAQKQQIEVNGDGATINFVIANLGGQPGNFMLEVNKTLSGALNFQVGGVSNTLYAPTVLNISDVGTTILGLFFDGTNLFAVSSPGNVTISAATIIVTNGQHIIV